VVVSAIAVYTEVTAFVVPVLLVPVLIPALVAGIELLGGGGANWAVVLGSYDGIVFLTGLLVFDELLV
jgi:heme exporter protein B